MTKLMNLNLQDAEILDKDEMKKIAGGGECICTAAIDDLGDPICFDMSTGARCFAGSGDNSDLRQKNIDACAHATVRDPGTGQVSECYASPCTFTSSNGRTRTGECRLIPFANPKECICFGIFKH